MYMTSLKSHITYITITVFEGIQGTLSRLNSTNTRPPMKEVAAIATPVLSPIQPTKGMKFESKLDLGVIQEDEEGEMNAELGCRVADSSESSPATVTSICSPQANLFHYTHLPGHADINGVIPDGQSTAAHFIAAAQTKIDTEKYTDKSHGTVPPSPLEIALMKDRLKRAPYVSSMLNPHSVRLFRPLRSHRADKNDILWLGEGGERDKNDIFLQALGNYTLQQAAKAEEVVRAREEATRAQKEAIERDEDDEQYLLVPPDDYEDVLAEYMDLDALADDIAERQAKAHAWYDMDDGDYY